jgi:serine/alanine adding enzyme
MQYTIHSKYSEIDKNLWTDFVFQHPHGNIFQTPEMYQLYQLTTNYEPFIFVAIRGGAVVGVLLALLQKEFRCFLGGLTARSIIIGGPLVENNDTEIAFELMNAYSKIIRKKAIYTQFRNIFDISPLKCVFEQLNYTFEDHLDIHVDLNKSEEYLWKDLNTKRRNEVRKAEKEQLNIRETVLESDIHTAYEVLKEVYSRAKLPLASAVFFDNAYNVFSEKKMIRFYGAFYEDKLIGTMIVLCYKNSMYDWYAGSFKEYYHKGPNNIIPWKVFLDAKEKGYTLFDFGGAGKPDKPYGVRDYKKKFGGGFVNFGRYEIIHKPLIYSIMSRLFILSQKLRKRI